MAEKRKKSSSEEKVGASGPPRMVPPGLGHGFARAGNVVIRFGRWFARQSSRTWSIRWMKWPILLAGMSAAAMLVGILSGLPLASLGEHRVKLSDAPLLQTLVAALVCAGFLSFLLGMPGLSVVLTCGIGGLVDRHSGGMDEALGGYLLLAGFILSFVAVSVAAWLLDREKKEILKKISLTANAGRPIHAEPRPSQEILRPHERLRNEISAFKHVLPRITRRGA